MKRPWFKLEVLRKSFGIEKNVFYENLESFLEGIRPSEDDGIPISIYFDETLNDVDMSMLYYYVSYFINFLEENGVSFHSDEINKDIEEIEEEIKQELEKERQRELDQTRKENLIRERMSKKVPLEIIPKVLNLDLDVFCEKLTMYINNINPSDGNNSIYATYKDGINISIIGKHLIPLLKITLKMTGVTEDFYEKIANDIFESLEKND